MYRVGVEAELSAKHYLIGDDFGPENELHEHPYRIAVELAGPALDARGFLVDIAAVRRCLVALVARLSAAVLNDLPELAGLNPSVEHLARFVAGELEAAIDTRVLMSLTVKVWEGNDAWASFCREL